MGELRHIVGLIALAVVAACAPISPGVPPAAAAPNTIATIDILHQTVEISPFADTGLTGAQTIRFSAATAGDRLRFLGGPLDIASLSVDGDPVADWRTTDGAIEVALGRTLRPGSQHALRLTYRAAPGRGFKRSDSVAYSTYFACDWMLCSQADFSDRFTFNLTIRTPRGMRTLGPGAAVGTTPLDDDTEAHHWRTTEAYPAYVHGFVAGRLETHDVTGACAVRLDVLTPAPTDRVGALFQPTCAMLEYFQDRAGVAYPADRYSQFYVADAWEAQEAISHSTLGGGAVEALLSDPTEDWAVAHELAHQWWGNRITAADLSGFWLNEGIVTFMTATWKEHRWGTTAYDREIDLARSRWIRCREQWRDVPLAFAGEYPSLTARRCIQYSKAAVFLHELRRLIGDDAFWRGVRRYTAANLGRATTSRAFETAMQAETTTTLHPLFQDWVYPHE